MSEEIETPKGSEGSEPIDISLPGSELEKSAGRVLEKSADEAIMPFMKAIGTGLSRHGDEAGDKLGQLLMKPLKGACLERGSG